MLRLRSRRRRRGLALMIVLSLLVLFLMLGVSFLMVASTTEKGARAQAKAELKRDDPKVLLDMAMYDVVIGPRTLNSVALGHGLLRDMYGMDGFTGEVAALPNPPALRAGGQFVELALNQLLDFDGNSYSLHPISGYYNGRVLTLVSGDARGTSARIVGYNATNGIFLIMLPKTDNTANAQSIAAGDKVVINGQAFSGTGFAYDDSTGQLTFESLFPNRLARGNLVNYLRGGADESYDAADLQNVALAAIVTDPNVQGNMAILPSFHRPELLNYLMNNSANWQADRQGAILRPMRWDHPEFTGSNPAFAVVNNGTTWTQGADGVWGSAGDDDSQNGVDDPGEAGYPGSDDVNSLLYGPWDIDNDNDGIADSIWLDFGFAVQTSEEGRMYKPLFAVLCLDMDGKLNLNAHGNRWHFLANPQKTTETLAGGIQSNLVKPGEGYGPAEIDLRSVFANTEYQRLLFGDTNFPGRYGADQLAGKTGLDLLASMKLFEYPNNYFTPTYTSFSTPDNLEGRLAFGLDERGLLRYERSNLADNRVDAAYEIDLSVDAPRGYSATASKDQPFSAAELESLLRIKDLDARELPTRLRGLLANTVSSHPDLARIVTTDSYDLPIPTVTETSELRIWRQRVNRAFAQNGATPQVQSIQFGSQHLSDFIAVRMLYLDLFPGNTLDLTRIDTDSSGAIDIGEAATKFAEVNTAIAKMLAPDFAKGTRLDVNHPFGNGIDDNGNGVIDEHHWQLLGTDAQNAAINESWWNEQLWNNGIYVDHDNDGNVRTQAPPGGSPDRDAFLARHQFAKYLYVLLMTLKDRNHQIDFDRVVPPNDTPEETARGIAQWCINVVDFRDADSIMTPFEYDLNPFNITGAPNRGWDVDGVIGPYPISPNNNDDTHPDRRLVWGCERPELLISETLAWHDRRTEDLATAGPGADTKTTDTTMDADFDQRLLPRGAFFVELYNPWSGDDRLPRELYDNSIPGVQLDKVNTFGTPVWRMIVAKGARKHRDPDMFDPQEPGYANRLRRPQDIDRSIYFTDMTVAGIQAIADHVAPFHPDSSISDWTQPNQTRIAPLLPGRYAVVGSSGLQQAAAGGAIKYVNPIGRRTDADEMLPDLKIPDTRQVVLKVPAAPGPNAAFDGCEVRNNVNPAAPDDPPPFLPAAPPAFNKPPVVGIPINSPRSLSISEPVNGYQPTAANMIVPNAAGEPSYSPPIDIPSDTEAELKADGTTEDYCTVHLQRLANPLAPWHATNNPYLTVDSMSTDVTAFNGVTNVTDPVAQADPKKKHLATLERGENVNGRQLWKHQQEHLGQGNLVNVPAGLGDHYFDRMLRNTFGYLNTNYGPIFRSPDPTKNGFPETSTASPFPWLQWNNRPFVSQYELALVPRTKSYDLPRDYSVYSPSPNEPYHQTPSAFGHLLNFFETLEANSNPPNGAHFYRLFDYTHVPSRFVGAETWLNPTAFRSGTGTDGWHTPFNRVSAFRDPGKVNINTIYDQRVWNAITAGHPAPNFVDIVKSRRGYDPSSNNILQLDPSMPTFFANPFRGAGERLLVPPPPSPPPAASMARNFDVETTLSRSNSVDPAVTLQSPIRPLLERTTTNQHDDASRNPYFRTQPATRLANLVTTRSNVYAIWITVGYFEVNPLTGTLGQELGSDSGEVERHRAFYMIDRSIPVAYQPGENHNVDNCIQVRRFIE